MRNSIFYILACTSLMLVQTLFACMPIGVTNGVCDCQSTPACSQCPAQQQSAQGFAYHYDAPRPVVQAAAHPTLINSHSSPIIPPPPKDPFTSEPYNSLETNFPGMSELTNLDATNDPYLMPAKNTPEFEMANNNLALSIRQIDEKDKLAHEQEVGSIIESSFDENVANQTEDSFLGTGIGYPAGEIKKGMGNGLSFTVEQASSNGLFEATTKATFLPTLSPIPEDSKSSVYKIKHESLKTTSFPYNSFPITSEATMQFTSLPNQICKGETISTSRERTVSAATVKCNIIGCTALNLKTINDTTIEVVYLQSLTTTLSLEGYTCLRASVYHNNANDRVTTTNNKNTTKISGGSYGSRDGDNNNGILMKNNTTTQIIASSAQQSFFNKDERKVNKGGVVFKKITSPPPVQSTLSVLTTKLSSSVPLTTTTMSSKQLRKMRRLSKAFGTRTHFMVLTDEHDNRQPIYLDQKLYPQNKTSNSTVNFSQTYNIRPKSSKKNKQNKSKKAKN